MTLSVSEFKERWSQLHGDAPTSGIVGGWLTISFFVAKRLRLSANALTSLGIIFALLTALFSPHIWSAFYLALSLICDGLDGTVAIVRETNNEIGATYDAVADRISEALWAFAFFRLGVPIGLVLALASLAAFQEYARARLGSAGERTVGVVTPSERPVRASFLFIAILASHFSFSHAWIVPIAVSATLLQALSFALVIRFSYRSLK